MAKVMNPKNKKVTKGFYFNLIPKGATGSRHHHLLSQIEQVKDQEIPWDLRPPNVNTIVNSYLC